MRETKKKKLSREKFTVLYLLSKEKRDSVYRGKDNCNGGKNNASGRRITGITGRQVIVMLLEIIYRHVGVWHVGGKTLTKHWKQ